MNKDGNAIDPDGKWFIWTYRPGRFDVVESYITSKVKEVTDVVCPSVLKVDKRCKNKVKVKRHLIYEDYLFLKYGVGCEENKIWHKLSSHPFINSCLGPCKQEELNYILNLRSELEDYNPEYLVSVGDQVEVTDGKFSGLSGIVVHCERDSVVVSVTLEESSNKIQLPVSIGDVKKT